MNGDVVAVEEAGERDFDAADGEEEGGMVAREVEAARGEESGESEAVGEEAELGDRKAERDDVETEGVRVRRRRLGHVEGEEGSVGGSEEGEGVSGVSFVVVEGEKVDAEIRGED